MPHFHVESHEERIESRRHNFHTKIYNHQNLMKRELKARIFGVVQDRDNAVRIS